MAAGYELTQLRPGAGEYKTVPKAVRPILQFIFEDGFPHSISKVYHSLLNTTISMDGNVITLSC